jgi:Uma2 family endonuclease
MTPTLTRPNTVAELLRDLGNIPAERVRLRPGPGTATEADLLAQHGRSDEIMCELVDGTLVEKAVGYLESTVAGWLIHLLYEFMNGRDLGVIGGEGGFLRLEEGLVRGPDVTFIRRERLPGGEIPDDAYPDVAPCLAVEVLSRGNTPEEMARKRREYFRTGTELVWQIDPRTREIEVFTAPEAGRTLGESDTLDGGNVLPGLALPVGRVFEQLPAH